MRQQVQSVLVECSDHGRGVDSFTREFRHMFSNSVYFAIIVYRRILHLCCLAFLRFVSVHWFSDFVEKFQFVAHSITQQLLCFQSLTPRTLLWLFAHVCALFFFGASVPLFSVKFKIGCSVHGRFRVQ